MILHPQIALCLARDRAQELHQAAACRRLRRLTAAALIPAILLPGRGRHNPPEVPAAAQRPDLTHPLRSASPEGTITHE
jgi:hypothetical protein